MSNKVYFNKMQLEVMAVGANTSVVVAGRGTGKGLLQAAYNLRNVQCMPGSTGAFVAPSAIRAKTNMIPSMTMHWEKWGFVRGIHWEVGVKPPKKLGWAKPIIEPLDYKNVISFYNGAIIQIVSQDRAGTSNSKSFDFLSIDEAKFINFDKLKNETFQANRGQQKEFGHIPYHHGMLITSDMPVDKKGSWFLKYEQDQDAEVIRLIGGLVAEINELDNTPAETEKKKDWHKRLRKRLVRRLNACRKNAVLFKVYSSLTNINVLGLDYIKKMKRDLPALVFYTSVLCLRPETNRMGFYSSMKPSHIYVAEATDFTNDMPLGVDFVSPDCRSDSDVDVNRPLCISFDYNRNINWLVVGQPDYDNNRLNTLKAFWVKYERKLPELVDDFCQYYKYMPLHEVVLYYDQTALDGAYAVNDETFLSVILDCFHAHGWEVTEMYLGKNWGHAKKHLLINQGFAGRNNLEPFFNRDNCHDLLISITTAGVYNGKKDKRGEKLAETEEDKLEARTDGSDAWDNLYIGCEVKPLYSEGIRFTSNWG